MNFKDTKIISLNTSHPKETKANGGFFLSRKTSEMRVKIEGWRKQEKTNWEEKKKL